MRIKNRLGFDILSLFFWLLGESGFLIKPT